MRRISVSVILSVSIALGAVLPALAVQSPSPSASPTPNPFQLRRVWNPDLRKAAERINELLASLNKKRTGVWERILTQLQKILDRIVASTEKRKARGADVTAVNEAIAKARTALDEARVAVREQAGKTYVLDDATDRDIRDRLHAVRIQLQEDLAAVAARVRAAHQAVSDAARALAHAKPAAPSPTPTP